MSYIFRGMLLPDDLQASIDSYVNFGVPTGGFLQACIDNDLNEACGRADEHNLPILPAIVAYLYNEAPTDSWGFAGAHDRYVRKKLQENKEQGLLGRK